MSMILRYPKCMAQMEATVLKYVEIMAFGGLGTLYVLCIALCCGALRLVEFQIEAQARFKAKIHQNIDSARSVLKSPFKISHGFHQISSPIPNKNGTLNIAGGLMADCIVLSFH